MDGNLLAVVGIVVVVLVIFLVRVAAQRGRADVINQINEAAKEQQAEAEKIDAAIESAPDAELSARGDKWVRPRPGSGK